MLTTRPAPAPRLRKTAYKRPSRAKSVFTPEELEALKEAYGVGIARFYIAVCRDEVIAEREAKSATDAKVAPAPAPPLVASGTGDGDGGVVGVGKNRKQSRPAKLKR